MGINWIQLVHSPHQVVYDALQLMRLVLERLSRLRAHLDVAGTS
jgi:hypothetical protein